MAKFVTPAEAAPAPVASFPDAVGRAQADRRFPGQGDGGEPVGHLVRALRHRDAHPRQTGGGVSGQARRDRRRSASTGPHDTDKAKAFIAKHAPLAFYQDPKMALPFAFKPVAAGMPTTVIYGADGVERGAWPAGRTGRGKDAKALIDKVLAEKLNRLGR